MMMFKKNKILDEQKLKGSFKSESPGLIATGYKPADAIAACLNPISGDISIFQISITPAQQKIKRHSVSDTMNMNTSAGKWNTINFKVLLFLSFIAFFSACQKVIDVDIKNAEKKYVVEAIVTDIPGESKVLLSTTKNVSENNDFPGISGAAVTITDDGGNVVTFNETTVGSYEAPNFTGSVGTTYSLLVKVNGETFTAESTMPQKINLDTLFISDEILFGETRKLVNIAYQDPPGKGQCYRYVQYINGIKSKPIFANNDDYSDGKYVETKLWYLVDDKENEEEDIESLDTIGLAMHCIDIPVYKYWYSLNQSATGNSQSASPANAVTNISGGALGYFSAHTVQTKSVVVP